MASTSHEQSDKHPLIKCAFERKACMLEHEIRRLLSIGSPAPARSSVAVAGSPRPTALCVVEHVAAQRVCARSAVGFDSLACPRRRACATALMGTSFRAVLGAAEVLTINGQLRSMTRFES